MAELPAVPGVGSESDYKPVSGVAVAAVLVAGAYVALMLGTTVFAMYSKRSALNIHLLWLAALGLALAVAARLHIRRSEQTRTGMACVQAAWWMSVLGGAAFGAYIMASQLAVQQQAERSTEEWFKLLREKKIDHAFLFTLPPNVRQDIRSDDTESLELRFGPGPLSGFRNCELARFFKRNGEDVQTKLLGVNNFDQIENGYRLSLAYLLKSPGGPIRG